MDDSIPSARVAKGKRLEGGKVQVLTPTVDHLFDRGFISFEGNGRVIVSPVAHAGLQQLAKSRANDAKLPKSPQFAGRPSDTQVLESVWGSRPPPRTVTDVIVTLYHIRYRAHPCHPQ
ncbi:MAG: hypothetical protein HC794_03730 [Nitrospiraceae bacterium]|nr:hypothetical protein [Nitrospiraceae bacterium]